jgi:hypothetical protein
MRRKAGIDGYDEVVKADLRLRVTRADGNVRRLIALVGIEEGAVRAPAGHDLMLARKT